MVVIIDCNIWISLTINGQIDFIADLFDKELVIASCDDLKNEITTVLNRPKFEKYISKADISKVVEMHDLVTTYYKPGKLFSVTKDPKDDYLFALSLKAKANYLVTGDKLLLETGRYKNTSVISLNDFRNILTRT